MRITRFNQATPATRQRGVTLFIALIAIVVLGLATTSLFRTAGGGLMVAGNLGMKRAATNAADFGVEDARRLVMNGTITNPGVSTPSAGYYAQWNVFNDLQTTTWDSSNSRAVTGHVTAGESIRVVVHRLCDTPGAASEANCVMVSGSSAGSIANAGGYGDFTLAAGGRVYYRVTARIEGAKNTVSYVQTVFY
jgi:type IV pilus assembly protein PilX